MNESNALTAVHFLLIYRRRKQGWEDGHLKYPKSIYEQIATLVKNLESLPETTKCWFESSSTGTIFYANGIEVGKLTDPN